MTRMRRTAAFAMLGALLLVRPASAQHTHPPHGVTTDTKATGPIRTTEHELHMSGGTPPGWRFTLPAGDAKAGRAVFVKLECYSCHAVRGEQFTSRTIERQPGSDLTGMGDKHPAEYFAEAILHPNAVIITEPGYTGPDGLSIMPSYADTLTLQEWIDLVAYLRSLKPKGDGPHRGH